MVVAVFCAATAQASTYKSVLCAANNGSNGYTTTTNTTSPQNPAGIFTFENHCGPAPDPAGNSAFLRVVENQSGGNAGVNAYGRISWTATPWVAIVAGGGYTREPNAFNEGWRARFWAEGWDGSTNNLLMQGAGVANGSLGGIGWAPTSTFAPHLWPFAGYGDYRRFSFELTCVRPSGCDRTNYNAADANTLQLILDDREAPSTSVVNSPPTEGDWVRGTATVAWHESDRGSGLRFSRLKVDDQVQAGATVDYRVRGDCDIGSSSASGEFARRFDPCPGGPFLRSYGVKTADLADGQHALAICVQDYGQERNGGESCETRTLRSDNSPPERPAALEVTSANPARYMSRVGARFVLPPNTGSPIVAVHYYVADQNGQVIVPEKVASGTNPTSLPEVAAPTQPGAYSLHVALEDQVGFVGPYATAPIPRDTTPPAAPQELAVAVPTVSRTTQGFDLRWRNIVDDGSPIAAAHYKVVDESGAVVVSSTSVEGEGIDRIADLKTPRARGLYTLRLWLSDGEGNVGAPAEVPLSYKCVRSDPQDGRDLTATLGPRSASLLTVGQGRSSDLHGVLRGANGPIGGATICVFSRMVTEGAGDFIGLAISGADGSYRFALGAGPSREVAAVYRPGQRQLEARAELRTRVRPTLRLGKKVVRNGGYATFFGRIPGPRNNDVVVVLQVKSGKGWRAFRRYRTRRDGRYKLRYRFTRTRTRTDYRIRAQVRATVGYAYEEGSSRSVRLRVVP